MSTLPGSCYCGAVSFEVTLPPRFVTHCHCENCRAAHSAAFVTWAGFTKDQFHLAEDAPVGRYHTDTQATRTFCRTCGTPLFYESPRWDGEVHVARSAIHGELPNPQAHVYADRAPEWCPITDALPQYGGATGTEALAPKTREP